MEGETIPGTQNDGWMSEEQYELFVNVIIMSDVSLHGGSGGGVDCDSSKLRYRDIQRSISQDGEVRRDKRATTIQLQDQEVLYMDEEPIVENWI